MTDQELEQRLRAWYRAEVDDREMAPLALRGRVLAIAGSRVRPRRAVGNRRNLTLLLAAAVATTGLIGGLVLGGRDLVRLVAMAPTSPSPEPSVMVVTTLFPSPTGPLATPTLTPLPTPAASPASAGMFATIQSSLLASDTVGWISTLSAIYRTADTGRTWTQIHPASWPTSASVGFVDADTMYAASSVPGKIAMTHDGGATWFEATVDIGTINGRPVFSFQTPSRVFASFVGLTTNGPLAVYLTTDGGLSWSGPESGQVPHMAASMDKLYAPVGGFLWQSPGKFDSKPFDNRFFLSADGGVSWTQYTFPINDLSPQNARKEVSAIVREDSGRLLIAMSAEGGRDPLPQVIYESTDDRSSWRLVQALPDNFGVQFLSPTQWIAFSNSPSEIRSTADGGQHWQTRATSPLLYAAQGIQFATLATGWAVLRPPTPQAASLIVTTDGGATWKEIGQ